jgi:chitodextrinase
MKPVRFTLVALLVLTAGTLGKPHAAFDPGKPKELKGKANGPHAVDLDWKNVRGSEGYYVYRDGNRVGSSERSEYRDDGLRPETTYTYRVSAFDDDGDEGDLSNAIQVTTEALPGPSEPTDLVATAAGPYRIDLTWSPSESESGIAFYRVFRDGDEIATTGETEYEDPDLAPETEYQYRVAAVDGLGYESDLSDPASATTETEPGPPPPRNLAAVAASAVQINLSWNPPATSIHPVQGYNVYRDGESIGFVVSTAFADAGRSPATTYGYTVSSVDTRGVEGELSDEVSATTDAPTDVIPPAPPTGLRLAGG